MSRFFPLAALFVLAMLGGCSPYLDGFQYSPRPAVVEIRPTSARQVSAVTAMASVIGVPREDRKLDIPESIELRLRLDDVGLDPITFDSRTLELTNAQLLPFPPPIVRMPSPITLDPGQSVTLTAFFPLPGRSESGDLDSLVVRWVVQIKEQKVVQTANFRRVYPRVYYYDPYWGPYRGYPPYFWYGGVVIIHRR